MSHKVVPVLYALVLLTSWSSSFVPLPGKYLPSCTGSVNLQRYHSILHSTIAARHDEGRSRQDNEENQLKCQGCQATFGSRNALFRHLRGEDDASLNCSIAKQARPTLEDELLMTTVIRYGYYGGILEGDDADSDITGERLAANEVVANMIHKSFIQHANAFLGDHYDFEDATTALSYSTATIMRQPTLRQEVEVVGAVSEVMSFNYRLRCKPETISMWKEYANSGQIQEHVQILLESENSHLQILLHHMDALVPRSSKFYAERSATQRSYTFLLPVTWIFPNIDGSFNQPAVDIAIEWYKHISQRSRAVRQHLPRASSVGKSNPAPEFISKLKQSLKASESETVPNRRVRRQLASDDAGTTFTEFGSGDESATRLSHGRFGQLWRKEKRCWSNFAHSSLTGMASSPGFEVVWRTMDRAQIVGVIDLQSYDNVDNEGAGEAKNVAIQNMHIVLVFKADGFVMGQIPRIISAVVGMTNGWLPPNFFDIATRPDVRMPGLPAPSCLYRRLYFQSARYHFHELTSNANGSSENSIESFAKTVQPDASESEQKWEEVIRERLLGGSSLTNIRDEEEWLLELRDAICPALRSHIEMVEAENLADISQVEDSAMESLNTLPCVDSDAPIGAYSTTLALLRDIASNGKWPATSDARSRVIKSPALASGNILATKKKNLVSKFPGQAISSGSFTVINEDIWGNNELPLGNSLFPELTKSVFELEKEIIRNASPLPSADGMKRGLSSSRRRLPSTHCAVNRNAQFTPHVDSGRGQGQTLSMIVGLGNYTGGETIVEGVPYDIRYTALEFDGWNQLHWTSQFKGERYSLVWFTPEVSLKDSNKEEDTSTAQFVQAHCQAVPFLPPLHFRDNSTDELVIKELLDRKMGNVYTSRPGFSLSGHECVLDVGAHIGVFSRIAMGEGCRRIISYEPEPSNFALLAHNLEIASLPSEPTIPVVELHAAAVVHGTSGLQTLVEARNENDGKQNTWRHCLEKYSQYVDRSTPLPSNLQKRTLQRFTVECVPFFGLGGALRPGVTFVKLDCEGAEMDILLSKEASLRSNWLDCTHLVVEWSFTKERRVQIFHEAIGNLRNAGFEVYYEGIGSWWDTDAGVMWPYPYDQVIFATTIPQLNK